MTGNIIDTLVEVTLSEPESFLKIRETLQRIGIASEESNTLYQSAHILHKRGKYYIVHFKELLALDGKTTNFSDNDRSRRNTIAVLLEEWGLLTIVNKDAIKDDQCPMRHIKVIPFRDKEKWTLVEKYTIGRKFNTAS